MDDDEFDFSDHDLDDLPANTLQQLETTAICATQHHRNDSAAHGSDYGLDDGDEVVNLDDEADAPGFAPAQQNYGYNPTNTDGNALYGDAMEVEEPPRQSQADVSKLLQRIKKVRARTAPS